MSGAEGMKELLRPLRVYDLEGLFLAGELAAMGAALDGVRGELEDTERESILLMAQDWGLEQIAGLLPRRPVADTAAQLGEAVAALLRIGGDSFTPAAIQDTLRGCGAVCRVTEGEPGHVTVSFPGIPGIPAGFGEMQKIIEDILPAHVLAEYDFWYLTWAQLEQKLPTWKSIEEKDLTWGQLETYVT